MKKIFILIILIFYPANFITASERSEKEMKLGVFKEDLKQINTF